MKYKYGNYPGKQFHDYKKRLHSLVHWLLIYAENDKKYLSSYFSTVQYKLDGLNELINYPTQLIEIMNLIESAKLLYFSEAYTHEKYRKIVLDIHELIDLIPDED